MRLGAIDLTVSGGVTPYTYQWSNGSFVQDPQILEAGHYMVRVFDANFAEVDGQITLTAPIELGLNFTKSHFTGNNNISCYSCANGNLQTNVTGGVAPYTYGWSTLQSTAIITNLAAGEYVVMVTDANGCTFRGKENMLQPDREDWTMGGNGNTNPVTQFIGTSDSVSLSFRTNNVERFKIKANGVINSSTFSGNGTGFLMVDSIGNFYKQNSNNSTALTVPWLLSGNTIGSKSFLGSLNNLDLVFKTNSNNSTAMVLKTSGDLQLKKYEFAPDGIFTNSAGYIDKIDFTAASDVLCGDGQFKPLSSINSGLWVSNGNTIYSANSSNIGIGTNTPQQKLEISHNTTGNSAGILMRNTAIGNFNSEIKLYHQNTPLWAIGCDVSHIGSQNFFIWDNTANGGSGDPRFLIDANGKVGIGITSPSEKLDVAGKGKFTNIQATGLSGNAGKIVILDANGNFAASSVTPNNLLQWPTHAGNISYSTGKVFIGMSTCAGCTSSNYDLYVANGIVTKDIKITAGTFPDYVFDDKYKLLSIHEYDSFIKNNNHLPGIPSSLQIEKDGGFELGDIAKKLLEKTEEQALYIIDLQKQIDTLNVLFTELSKK